MVVFTCNHCGESLHKPKVEKHYQFQCRNYKSVTCVDCFKDFSNEEYVVHTKCITEDERYAAKGTYQNGIVKKGEVKQESWLEMIKSICETEPNLKPSIKKLLETISEYSNVPRKKVKFMNFIRSSSGNRANMQEVEEVWDIIEKHKAKNASNNQNNVKNDSENQKTKVDEGNDKAEQAKKRPSESVDSNVESPKKKKKKGSQERQEVSAEIVVENTQKVKKNKPKVVNEKLETPRVTNDTDDTAESSKFNYKAKILEILTEKHTISHKKLQKKVLKAYLKAVGQNESEEKIIKKFNKKLKKIPNISIEDDTVLLQA